MRMATIAAALLLPVMACAQDLGAPDKPGTFDCVFVDLNEPTPKEVRKRLATSDDGKDSHFYFKEVSFSVSVQVNNLVTVGARFGDIPEAPYVQAFGKDGANVTVMYGKGKRPALFVLGRCELVQ